MYVLLLATATRECKDDPGIDLAALARTCRAELIGPGRRHAAPAFEVLVAEVRYDGALLRLCTSLGIDTAAGRFSPAGTERDRLERELARQGIDLASNNDPALKDGVVDARE